jgi:hypothetical protein
MDNDYTIGLPTWECDVHGQHSAILHIRAVSVERKQERRYCVFCIMEHLDASGLKEMRDTALGEEKPLGDKDK